MWLPWNMPPWDNYDAKKMRKASMQAFVLMACSVAITIGLSELVDHLKDEEHQPILLISIFFIPLFFLGMGLLLMAVNLFVFGKRWTMALTLMTVGGYFVLLVCFYFGI